jgi:hypothetical protein
MTTATRVTKSLVTQRNSLVRVGRLRPSSAPDVEDLRSTRSGRRVAGIRPSRVRSGPPPAVPFVRVGRPGQHPLGQDALRPGLDPLARVTKRNVGGGAWRREVGMSRPIVFGRSCRGEAYG